MHCTTHYTQEYTKEYSGFLLTLEGIDGSGKSSLAHYLARELEKRDYPVLLTHEPGGTPLGQNLRTLLHTRNYSISAQAEFLLFAADRAQHAQEILIPALQAGKLVISDRFADSSIAYQGYGRGLDLDLISYVNTWALQALMPDLTLYLRLDYKTALERLQKRNLALTAFEQEKADFFKRVSAGFQEIFHNKPHVITLDATALIERVHEQALEVVLAKIHNNTYCNNTHE
jgi:dTMP kinase